MSSCIAFHFAASGELRRRRQGDGLQHGDHRRADLLRTAGQECAAGDELHRVVVLVALKKVDAPRLGLRGSGLRDRPLLGLHEI
jgi:hypothetical protein